MGKHGVVISDLHCGHKFWLCPPDHWEPESDDPTQTKIRQWQMRTWEWYAAKAKALGHLDRLIVNGDITTTWSVGCMCGLSPEFMPLNDW